MSKGDPTILSQPEIPLRNALRKAINALIHTGKYTLFMITMLTVFGSVMPALQVRAVAMLVASILPSVGKSSHSTITAVALLSVAIIGSYVSEQLIKYLSNRLTLKLSFVTEIQLIERLQSFEVQDFESSQTYDKIQRVDANTGQQIFNLFNSVRSGLQALISIAGIVIVVAAWNIWIAVALIIAPIPAVVATFDLQNKVFHVEYERAPTSRLANYFRELLCSDSTRKEIRIFQLGNIFEERYVRILRSFLEQDLLLAKLGLTRAGTLGLISVATNVAAIVLASLVAAKTGRAGELAGFISASTQMNAFVMTAFLGIIGSYQHLRYVSNWVALMETTPARISEGTLELGRSNHRDNQLAGIFVEFRNVSFTYPGTNQSVLNSVSFSITAGKITALVGQNGSGKTTICKLLLRFYEPTSGLILINGVDISKYTRASLYRLFSGLFQDFSKFECSIGDNISYGIGKSFEPENDANKVEATLSLVGLEPLIHEAAEGLDTVLGRRFEGGQQLSIGQWQRLATARALHKEPRLLILDEPTASVDAVSEREMFRALRDVSENLTILLVAHRFKTISHADHIIVLDHGEIVGDGSHNELLASCDLYKQIYEAQQDGV
mgnify:CR=1 FL=1